MEWVDKNRRVIWLFFFPFLNLRGLPNSYWQRRKEGIGGSSNYFPHSLSLHVWNPACMFSKTTHTQWKLAGTDSCLKQIYTIDILPSQMKTISYLAPLHCDFYNLKKSYFKGLLWRCSRLILHPVVLATPMGAGSCPVLYWGKPVGGWPMFLNPCTHIADP